MTKILTVILNYKTPDMTLRALDHALLAMQDLEGEITVVDNASEDGSFEQIAAHVEKLNLSHVRVIASDRNGGFGAGNNVGIRAGLSDGTKPDYVYILNSDAFPAPDAIQLLLQALKADQTLWAAGSFIHGEEDDPHQTLFRFPSVASEFEGAIRFGPVSRFFKDRIVPLPVPETDARADWMAGASVMMRQDVLDQIGLFDETFFLYFEETDLFLRARRAGYGSIYVRDSHVMHIGSVSTGMKEWARVPDYWYDSRLHYFVKNHGVAYTALATTAHLLGGSLYWLRRSLERKPMDVPKHFLRVLLTHDLKFALRALVGARNTKPSSAVPADRNEA
ncbi:glycosyltransferase family 2 protein [Thalassovita sp.]|jgi:GT2 family glycosyltransferase|uniref:glycosyltransferase family 2 protein n=1 Tax=Thalassovita sp. TaxID=1979401 RepID=UPI003B5CBF29